MTRLIKLKRDFDGFDEGIHQSLGFGCVLHFQGSVVLVQSAAAYGSASSLILLHVIVLDGVGWLHVLITPTNWRKTTAPPGVQH